VFTCGYNDRCARFADIDDSSVFVLTACVTLAWYLTCSGQCAIGTTERVPTLRYSPGLSSNRTVRVFSGNGSEHLAALGGTVP
jgi:hypothetical protein